MLGFLAVGLLSVLVAVRSSNEGFSQADSIHGHREYVCKRPYCHADIGASSHAFSRLVDGELIAFRFPVPPVTPSEALNYRGLQLAFSFYCDDHQASTILLTEKTYSFLLELWSSGTQPRDRLPDATILPRFSRDYSFENAEVSGIVNRLIPFGLLEQEMGGHGARPEELVLVVFRHGISTASPLSITVTASYLPELDLTKALSKCELDADHGRLCHVTGCATLFRHEYVAVEVKPPPRAAGLGPSGTLGSTGARLHFSYRADIAQESQRGGPSIETSLPLFRSEIVSARAFRRIAMGELNEEDTGKDIELHYAPHTEGHVTHTVHLAFGDGKEGPQTFLFSFLNFHKAVLSFNCTVEYLPIAVAIPMRPPQSTILVRPPAVACSPAAIRKGARCVHAKHESLFRVGMSYAEDVTFPELVGMAAEIRSRAASRHVAGDPAEGPRGDAMEDEHAPRIGRPRGREAPSAPPPLTDIWMTFVGEGNPLLHADFQRSELFPVKSSLKVEAGACILSDAHPTCTIPPTTLRLQSVGLVAVGLVDRPTHPELPSHGHSKQQAIDAPRPPAAIHYRFKTRASEELARSWAAGASLLYGFHGLTRPEHLQHLTTEFGLLDDDLPGDGTVLCLGYMGVNQPGFAHFVQPLRFNVSTITFSAEMRLLSPSDPLVVQFCSTPPGNLELYPDGDVDPLADIHALLSAAATDEATSPPVPDPSEEAEAERAEEDGEEEVERTGDLAENVHDHDAHGVPHHMPHAAACAHMQQDAAEHDESDETRDPSEPPRLETHAALASHAMVEAAANAHGSMAKENVETARTIARIPDPVLKLVPSTLGEVLTFLALLGVAVSLLAAALTVGWVLGKRQTSSEVYDIKTPTRTPSGREMLKKLSVSFRRQTKTVLSSLNEDEADAPMGAIVTSITGEEEEAATESRSGSRSGSRKTLLQSLSNSFKSGRKEAVEESMLLDSLVNDALDGTLEASFALPPPRLRMRGAEASSSDDVGVTTAFQTGAAPALPAPAALPSHLAIPAAAAQAFFAAQLSGGPGRPSTRASASTPLAVTPSSGSATFYVAPSQGSATSSVGMAAMRPSLTTPFQVPAQPQPSKQPSPQWQPGDRTSMRSSYSDKAPPLGLPGPLFDTGPVPGSHEEMVRRMRHSAHVVGGVPPAGPSMYETLTLGVENSFPASSPMQLSSPQTVALTSPPVPDGRVGLAGTLQQTPHTAAAGGSVLESPSEREEWVFTPQRNRTPWQSAGSHPVVLSPGPRAGAHAGELRSQASIGSNRQIAITVLRSESSVGGRDSAGSDSAPSPSELKKLPGSATARSGLGPAPMLPLTANKVTVASRTPSVTAAGAGVPPGPFNVSSPSPGTSISKPAAQAQEPSAAKGARHAQGPGPAGPSNLAPRAAAAAGARVTVKLSPKTAPRAPAEDKLNV